MAETLPFATTSNFAVKLVSFHPETENATVNIAATFIVSFSYSRLEQLFGITVSQLGFDEPVRVHAIKIMAVLQIRKSTILSENTKDFKVSLAEFSSETENATLKIIATLRKSFSYSRFKQLFGVSISQLGNEPIKVSANKVEAVLRETTSIEN